jgi:SNF2 family DNA or RNA helicase
MNNNKYELGIQYAFLNNSAGFSELINLYSHQNNEKNVELENQLIAYNELCVKNNFVFYYVEKKSDFQKNAVILSLPIDKDMLFKVNKMSHSHIVKQRRFLSHPSALFKDEDISTLPCCTKANAVGIILQSMLYNEKAVIFSLYIDVLIVYADICHNLGYPAMIITGNDKGGKLKQKLNEFENSTKIRVLLTTLQKSAEGFNFYYATHVIILEF